MSSNNDEEVGGNNNQAVDVDNCKGMEVTSGNVNESDDVNENTSGRRIKNKFALCLILSVNICLIIIFIYSAVVQVNDVAKNIVWNLFYGFNAIIYSVYLVLFVCFPHQSAAVMKPLELCIVALIGWAIGLIITSSILLANADGTTAEEENDPKFTDTTEKAFDIAGACLCFAAAVYHYILLKCSFT